MGSPGRGACVKLAQIADVPTMKERALRALGGAPAAEPGDLGARIDTALGTSWRGGGRGAPAPEPPGDEDARTLWVDFDEHGERWKGWRSVCKKCSEQAVEQWRHIHEGPPVTLEMIKAINREGEIPAGGTHNGAGARG